MEQIKQAYWEKDSVEKQNFGYIMMKYGFVTHLIFSSFLDMRLPSDW